MGRGRKKEREREREREREGEKEGGSVVVRLCSREAFAVTVKCLVLIRVFIDPVPRLRVGTE
jgi:hypothetical protein